MFQNILKILFLYTFIITIDANTECYKKFNYEMEKNLNDKNITLKQLRQHILIANYYLEKTFYNNNYNNNYKYKNELKLLKNICQIDYNKLDYPEIKRKIKISNESKDKLILLINTKKNIYNLYCSLIYYIIFFISLYIFIKYTFLIIPVIIYYNI